MIVMKLVLFPNQLLEHEPIKLYKKGLIDEIVLWEDPVFFGDRRGSPHGPRILKLNRMRILYMRVAMRLYQEWLTSKGISVTRMSVYDLWTMPVSQRYKQLQSDVPMIAFDPADALLTRRMQKVNIQFMDSPSFMMTSEWANEYYKTVRNAKRLQHAPFFAFMKKKLNVLVSTPNMDTQNRSPFPNNHELPPTPYIQTLQYAGMREVWWKEEVKELERRDIFWDNPGPVEDPRLPMTHRDVRNWLDKFIQERFSLFGIYEDAVVSSSQYVYHSGMSIYLNMGLITPRELLDTITAHGKDVDVATYEGYVRQLIGWREYARFYYLNVPPSIYTRNVFKCKNKPLAKAWYAEDSNATGFKVVDEAIRDAWKYGYLHHIRRLMVLSNFMTLSEIHPDRVFAWMYEFSLDSFDFVMVFNVYSMGTWGDGGYAMRKPYISGASYLRRMASMKDPSEIQRWNKMFRDFANKHSKILSHTQLARVLKEHA
jgi:deoxyribodipyrimidine photolyase-related protein